MEKELLAGASPRRVRQRLSPKVWVVDWDVRPAPVAAGSPPRPPLMRDMLNTLRAQARACALPRPAPPLSGQECEGVLT